MQVLLIFFNQKIIKSNDWLNDDSNISDVQLWDAKYNQITFVDRQNTIWG